MLFHYPTAKKDDSPEIDNTADFGEYVEEEMDAQNIPAVSLLIFKQDEILYQNYLGKPDIELDAPLANDHLFLLASISKVVTATALLQLYEEGAFNLDDKINDHLVFDIHVPNQTVDITFRMLLTHTSAIADGSALDDQYYYGEDPTVSLDNFMISYFIPVGTYYNAEENFHDFEPGTQHEYTNEGNALIGLLVEKISGLDFNTYCKLNIFEPLGMTNTSWRLDEITQTIVRPYNYENGAYEAIAHYTFADYPNGGLRSTVVDMHKFLQAFTQNGQSNNHTLLNPLTVEAMITPQIPTIDNTMGLHFFLMDETNTLWGHDGGEQGVATIMAFNPTTKVGAIILTNQGEADLEEMLVEAYKLGLTL